jgi:hypothetical protein
MTTTIARTAKHFLKADSLLLPLPEAQGGKYQALQFFQRAKSKSYYKSATGKKR